MCCVICGEKTNETFLGDGNCLSEICMTVKGMETDIEEN